MHERDERNFVIYLVSPKCRCNSTLNIEQLFLELIFQHRTILIRLFLHLETFHFKILLNSYQKSKEREQKKNIKSKRNIHWKAFEFRIVHFHFASGQFTKYRIFRISTEQYRTAACQLSLHIYNQTSENGID